MRNLQTGDVFELARLIKIIGIKEELKQVAMKVNDGAKLNVYEMGFEVVLTILEKCVEKNSEDAFYGFLSKPLEITKEEVERMDPFELVEKILDIASVEKWKSFLKLAVR